MLADEEFARRLRRLAWDCRRGMKEIDVFLQPFQEKHFATLARAEQEAFIALLDHEDVDLLDWFTQRTQPAEPALAAMVQLVIARVGKPG